MEIKTLGDFRRLTKDLDDDFQLNIKIMNQISEDELKNRSYPYPWDTSDGKIEFHDIGHSDKVICFGVYEK